MVICAARVHVVRAQVDVHKAPASLKTVVVDDPPGLLQVVKNKNAAVVLGKALYWDMQAGSDGFTACASCHHRAGADGRTRNALNTGSGMTFEIGGPNHLLSPADFPFHKLADPDDRLSAVLFDTDDVCGSQGVFSARYSGFTAGSWLDLGMWMIDPIFNVGGIGLRQVTARNSPSTINAVFNHRQFWDGRATDVFNGVDPFGPNSRDALVFKVMGTAVQPINFTITRCSLASQAVGPPGSSVEMAHAGRDLRKLAKKLLKLQPLARQRVHPQDSVLAPFAVSDPFGKGLKVPYAELIKLAFKSEYWNSTKGIKIGPAGQVVMAKPPRPSAPDEYTLMEANFGLFWGLAIQSYESTLVSDDTPYDRYAEGQMNALSAEQIRGLDVFLNKGRCIGCHSGPLFSSATIPAMAEDPDPDPNEPLIEGMVMADGNSATYDVGFYNIGVRPTAEDLGIGGAFPSGGPLSVSRARVPDGRTAVDGAFKTPTLRNIELTGPYFHNGGQATLQQVVQFYDRGGDFAEANILNLAPEIVELGLSEQDKSDLVAFLKSLTDERVRLEMAPFDHPELWIANGHITLAGMLIDDGTAHAVDEVIYIPAVGRAGGPPIRPFLE